MPQPVQRGRQLLADDHQPADILKLPSIAALQTHARPDPTQRIPFRGCIVSECPAPRSKCEGSNAALRQPPCGQKSETTGAARNQMAAILAECAVSTRCNTNNHFPCVQTTLQDTERKFDLLLQVKAAQRQTCSGGGCGSS
eukprot:7377011-Prymnesium_polylepis.4